MNRSPEPWVCFHAYWKSLNPVARKNCFAAIISFRVDYPNIIRRRAFCNSTVTLEGSSRAQTWRYYSRAATESVSEHRDGERERERPARNVESFLGLYSGGIAPQIRGTFTGWLRHRARSGDSAAGFRRSAVAVAVPLAVSSEWQ